MRKLTTADVPPRAAYLALQSEAVERYLGRPRQTLAALLLAPWFSVRIVHRFALSDFSPPNVDVVMIRMQKRGPPLIAARGAQAYRDFVVALFVSRKPSIGATSSQLFGGRVSRRLLHAAQIDPASSPSALALPAWLRLFGHFARLPAQIRNSVAGTEKRLRRRQQGLQKIHRTRVPRDALSVGPAALRLPSRWLHSERSLTQNPRDAFRPCPGPLLLTRGTYRRPREAQPGDSHLKMDANR